MKSSMTAGFMAACALALPAVAFAQLPNGYQTPGATLKVDAKQVCAADFASKLKPVANWQREQALERYGQRPEDFKGDLDHLVPAILGGSNDPDNLWPMNASGEMTVEAKARLTEKLHQMVCDGKMSLKDAQNAFKKDWTKSYKLYMGALNAPGGE